MAHQDTEFEKEIKKKMEFYASKVKHEHKKWSDFYLFDGQTFNEYSLYSAKYNKNIRRKSQYITGFIVAYIISIIGYYFVFSFFTEDAPVFLNSQAILLRDLFPPAIFESGHLDVNMVESIIKAMIAAIPVAFYLSLAFFIKRIDFNAEKEADRLFGMPSLYFPKKLTSSSLFSKKLIKEDDNPTSLLYIVIGILMAYLEYIFFKHYYSNYIAPADVTLQDQGRFLWKIGFWILFILIGFKTLNTGFEFLERKYNGLAVLILLIPLFVVLTLFSLAPTMNVIYIVMFPAILFIGYSLLDGLLHGEWFFFFWR